MKATISVALFNKDNITAKFIKFLEQSKLDDVEVIFINNGSTDNTEFCVFRANLKNKVYIPNGLNMGFPTAHNKALSIARGEYFIVINNDFIFNDKIWLDRLLQPLEDISVALVGIEGTPCQLRPDGTGFVGLQKDYVEGSCIAGRTDFLRQFGLFSENYKMFFYEDSDLSLRVRQAGFKIRHTNIAHEHLRSQSFSGIDQAFKIQMMEHNKRIFHDRWSKYLHMKNFSNNILIKMFSAGIGDIIAVTPVLEGLRKDHPTANLELETSFPEVFENNPHINGVYGVRKGYDKGYDREVNLEIDYSSYDLICEEATKIAATSIKSFRPQLFLSGYELEYGKGVVEEVKEYEDDVVVGVNLHLKRSGWAGRNYRSDYSKELIKRIKEELGWKIIELGQDIPHSGESDLDMIGQTSLRELMGIIANLDCMVCIDSLPLHIAQSFSIPTFVLMGAVEPIARISDFANTFPIRQDIDCIGCYQQKGSKLFNRCYRGDEICMSDLSPDLVMAYLTGEINCQESNIRYLQKMGRKNGAC